MRASTAAPSVPTVHGGSPMSTSLHRPSPAEAARARAARPVSWQHPRRLPGAAHRLRAGLPDRCRHPARQRLPAAVQLLDQLPGAQDLDGDGHVHRPAQLPAHPGRPRGLERHPRLADLHGGLGVLLVHHRVRAGAAAEPRVSRPGHRAVRLHHPLGHPGLRGGAGLVVDVQRSVRHSGGDVPQRRPGAPRSGSGRTGRSGR